MDWLEIYIEVLGYLIPLFMGFASCGVYLIYKKQVQLERRIDNLDTVLFSAFMKKKEAEEPKLLVEKKGGWPKGKPRGKKKNG